MVEETKVVKKVVKTDEKAPAAPAPATVAKKVVKVAEKKAKGAQVNVYGLDGKVTKQIELPGVFATDYRPDVIRRAVLAMQSHQRQPYGQDPFSGMNHAVSWWGKGRGVSRVPRLTQGRRGAQSPGCVGGRPAHPPKVEKIWFQKINVKERRLALHSALRAASEKPLVKARGHKFEEDLTLPIVLDDKVQSLKKTREVIETLSNVGVLSDLQRAEDGISVRAGRGKLRGRRYRTPTSVLLVVAKRDGIEDGAGNLPGVQVVTPDHLNAEILAPGGVAGRLTVFSESALSMMKEW